MISEFRNKTVVVTGASSGIGRAVSAAFADEGAHVYMLAIDDEIYNAASEVAEGCSAKITPVQVDITDEQGVYEAFSGIGKIDSFVANAGVEKPTPLCADSANIFSDFDQILDVNISGTFRSIAFAAERMQSGGSITITSSIWGKTGVSEFSGYVASKHANLGLMRTLARELGPRGIRVNAICPGWVRTGPAMKSLEVMAEKQGRLVEDLLNDIRSEQCFGDIQSPEDVAQSYLMLASRYSSNITGQAINVDRGSLIF